MEATSIEAAAEALLAPSEPTAEEVVAEPETPEVEVELDETEADTSDDDQEIVEDEDSEEEYEGDDSEESEEYEQDEDEADQAGPETFTVKVDGEEVEVTLDDLKRDFSGQAYIQKGMKQAAEAKKQAEEAYTQLGAQQQQLQQLMHNLQQNGMLKQPTPPSADLAREDPLEWQVQRAKYDEDMIAFGNQQQEIAKQQQQMQAAQAQAQKAYLQEQHVELVKAIPEFGDEKKAPKIRESLVKYGVKVGFTPEQIGAIDNSKTMVTLHKAMLYDQIMADQSKAQDVVKAKVKKAKPLMKAGAKKPVQSAAKKQQAKMSKLKKSGSVADAAALLFNG